jgi:hypothetical protein
MEIRSKTCRNCGETKPVSEFYSRRPASTGGKDYAGSLAGISADCKVCHRAYAAARRKRLGSVHAKYMKDFDLRRKYGIGIDQFNKMFAQQDGRCAICGRHQTEFVKGLAVDHDHSSGAVRSLLCPNCNHGLGCFKEDGVLLKKAIAYLEVHSTNNTVSVQATSDAGVNGGQSDPESVH